jgi:DNA-binding MarR family transcriptional regulator
MQPSDGEGKERSGDGKERRDLITVALDPQDRRRRLIRLTAKGQAFINQLEETLEG